MTNPTVADVVSAAARRLAARGSSTPRLDAEVLLRHVLGLDRTRFFLRLRDPVSASERAAFAGLLDRRLAGEPVAYLTGGREFMGLPLATRASALVPRPETEGLVEWALARLATMPNATVVDVGTGTGAIALAIAANLTNRSECGIRVVACDISGDALALAAENRSRHDMDPRVALLRGNLLTWCAGPIDLVLANLPYLRPDQVTGNPDLRAEPMLALLGGADGLDPIRRLIADLPRVLAPSGAVALEIDPSQADTVGGLLATALPDADVSIRPDFAGHPRVAVAARPR